MFCFGAIFISTYTHQLEASPAFYDFDQDKMKIYLLILLAIVILLIDASEGGINTGVFSPEKETSLGGFWKSRVQWKAHWVKDWEMKKIYIPVWRKVWGPVNLKEWIPFPKMPPKH